MNISLSGVKPQLRIVPVSSVSPTDLVDFRKQAHAESEYVNPLTLASATTWVAHRTGFYVLLRGSKLVGQLVIDEGKEHPEILYIDLISVLKEEQGGRAAELLMRQAEKLSKPFKYMQLVVYSANTRAIKFYEKHGFKLVKRLGRLALLYAKTV